MMSFKPKMASIVAAKKPDWVQPMGEVGPPKFDAKTYTDDGVKMAAQRLIDGINSGNVDAVVSAIRNLTTLMDCASDMSGEE